MKTTYEEKLFSWIDDFRTRFGDREVKVWVHPVWRRKISGFLVGNQDKDVYTSEADIQGLMLNAALLVTDYSSIAFDAAISGLPVVFFRPDREEFARKRGLYPYSEPEDTRAEVFDGETLLQRLRELLTSREAYAHYRDISYRWARFHTGELTGQNGKKLAEVIDRRLQENFELDCGISK